jgi:hypothetical protein
LPFPKQGIVINLDHLRPLMDRFITEQPPHDRLETQLRFSSFLSWLERKQMKEVTNGPTDHDSNQ